MVWYGTSTLLHTIASTSTGKGRSGSGSSGN